MLVVGSKALNKLYPNREREIIDVDVIAYKADADKLQSVLQPTKVLDKGTIISFMGIQNKTELFDKDNVEFLLADDSVSLKKYLDHDDAHTDVKFASSEVLFSLKKITPQEIP